MHGIKLIKSLLWLQIGFRPCENPEQRRQWVCNLVDELDPVKTVNNFIHQITDWEGGLLLQRRGGVLDALGAGTGTRVTNVSQQKDVRQRSKRRWGLWRIMV